MNKFTADKSTLEITFLDIKVCKGEILIGNPTLEVQTYHKDIGTFKSMQCNEGSLEVQTYHKDIGTFITLH